MLRGAHCLGGGGFKGIQKSKNKSDIWRVACGQQREVVVNCIKSLADVESSGCTSMWLLILATMQDNHDLLVRWAGDKTTPQCQY